MESQDLVLIATYRNRGTAVAAQRALDAAGIGAVLETLQPSRADVLAARGGGSRILVTVDDAMDATSLLGILS